MASADIGTAGRRKGRTSIETSLRMPSCLGISCTNHLVSCLSSSSYAERSWEAEQIPELQCCDPQSESAPLLLFPRHDTSLVAQRMNFKWCPCPSDLMMPLSLRSDDKSRCAAAPGWIRRELRRNARHV